MALNPDLETAHNFSFEHEEQIRRSEICGCFYCCETFGPGEITEWIDDAGGRTACCPRCGIDSVIGSASGISISKAFLKEMHQHWFGE